MWDVVRGEGTVVAVYTYNCDNPVVVEFDNGFKETYTFGGKYSQCVLRTLFPYPVEVVMKVTKPSINWEHVRDDYKFLARSASGNAWLYSGEPVIEGKGWEDGGFGCAEANSYASYTPGTCDWKDSLVKRPD